jgi:hypothetical protein
MSEPSYWSDKASEPGTSLATEEDLVALNLDSRAAQGTGLRDLSAWTETEYNGTEWAEKLEETAMDRAARLFQSYGVRYDSRGREYKNWADAAEAIFVPMIENTLDDDATQGEQEIYAICTTASTLRNFPSEESLFTQSGPEGTDYQIRSEVLLGEPLILKGESRDGKFAYAYTSADSGWVRWEDVAVCYNRDEWLRAWQFDDENSLVVYGDGVRTQMADDNSQGASLHMGTRLQLVDPEEYANRYSFNSARGDWVVWLPLRGQEGWYEAEMAVVSRNDEVSQGPLPLTSANLAAVALKKPKEVYRWSQGEDLQDCTSHARRVYRCFGLDLARSISGQSKQPIRQYNLDGLSDAEKTRRLKKLPLGSLLCVQGKELLYLGHVGDRLYAISAADVRLSDTDERHSTVVDTLDTLVPGGKTLLNELSLAMVPYYNAQAADLSQAKVTGVKDVNYKGKAVAQRLKVRVDGCTLREGTHYTLSYKHNDSVGQATVTIRGRGNWQGKLRREFTIRPAATRLTKLKGGEGSLSAQWEEKSDVQGYLLQYSTDEDFEDAVSVKVKGKTSWKGEKLSAGRYYVRVRSYAWSEGEKYNSTWSEAMGVEVE